MKKLYLLIFLIATTPIQIISAADVPSIIDMCPSLPKEIASFEPKYKDFVTAKPPNKDWSKQYEKYTKAKDDFEAKYSNELKNVESEWDKLNQNQSPSQKRFYDLVEMNSKQGELLKEVKSVCWSEVMGLDEFEKDNLCNPIKKPPTSKEWNEILVCTMKRANLLSIEIYQ